MKKDVLKSCVFFFFRKKFKSTVPLGLEHSAALCSRLEGCLQQGLHDGKVAGAGARVLGALGVAHPRALGCFQVVSRDGVFLRRPSAERLEGQQEEDRCERKAEGTQAERTQAPFQTRGDNISQKPLLCWQETLGHQHS